MKVSKSQLKKIIKEELEHVLREGLGDWYRKSANWLGRKAHGEEVWDRLQKEKSPQPPSASKEISGELIKNLIKLVDGFPNDLKEEIAGDIKILLTDYLGLTGVWHNFSQAREIERAREQMRREKLEEVTSLHGPMPPEFAPALKSMLPEKTKEEYETMLGNISAKIEEILQKYYAWAKLNYPVQGSHVTADQLAISDSIKNIKSILGLIVDNLKTLLELPGVDPGPREFPIFQELVADFPKSGKAMRENKKRNKMKISKSQLKKIIKEEAKLINKNY